MSRWILAVGVALATWVGLADHAAACGCFSPPLPPPGVTADQYAVAQQSEQIIFEIEPGFVTAHVLIRYQGKPESFAWILPVPTEPEISLSENVAFALIDGETRPVVEVENENLCPVPNYECRVHPRPVCGSSGGGGGCGFDDDSAPSSGSDSGIIALPDGGGSGVPPVDVISREVIGSYETIVFAASDAMAAVGWLQDEGFIVNDTTTPYMQPYLDEGMLFVASRLVAGAGVDEIRPLKLRYAADDAMIPLQLTAVAAEPHLTVTAFVYSDSAFGPIGRPVTEVDASRITLDTAGRDNYPMVLARAIDDAGGDAFVIEYDGRAPTTRLGDDICCLSGFDQCGIGRDGQCQCPAASFDSADCEAIPGLDAGLELVADLAYRYTWMTRITTRLSAEEMTFDPAFGRSVDHLLDGRLNLTGHRSVLARCTPDILVRDEFDAIVARQSCSSVYCGVDSECAVTADGGGCACGPGTVARAFTDSDGLRSVTCVPDVPPIDLSAGGAILPSACASVDCGFGACVDLGGFAACRCNPGAAAVVVAGVEAPACRSITQMLGTPGAEDFSGALDSVRVCAPAPPATCGRFGWLEETTGGIRGEVCESSMPNPALLEIPPAQTCDDLGLPGRAVGGGGCAATSEGSPLAGLGLLWVALALVFVRRRR
jgi:hypothetical protein